jgi:hypothetical protein
MRFEIEPTAPIMSAIQGGMSMMLSGGMTAMISAPKASDG